MTTGWSPSLTPSLIPEIVKVADSIPAAMVIEVGTTASDRSLERRLTVRGELRSALRRTVATAVPDSEMTVRSRVRERLALSSSRICKVAVAEPLGKDIDVFV